MLLELFIYLERCSFFNFLWHSCYLRYRSHIFWNFARHKIYGEVSTALIQDQDGVLFLVSITGITFLRNPFYENQTTRSISTVALISLVYFEKIVGAHTVNATHPLIDWRIYTRTQRCHKYMVLLSSSPVGKNFDFTRLTTQIVLLVRGIAKPTSALLLIVSHYACVNVSAWHHTEEGIQGYGWHKWRCAKRRSQSCQMALDLCSITDTDHF